MSNKKTKHKSCKPRECSVRSQHGYDFGSSEQFLLVASFDFVQALSKADVFACAYGLQRNALLRVTLPVVTLVGKHADSLKSAFQEFTRWGADEDGDVVALTFVFLKEGGYLLGVGHDPERLGHRLRAYDRVFVPLQYSGSWVKKFDTRNPALQQLANQKKSLISPFLFSAAIHFHADDPSSLDVNAIQPVGGLEPILKFEANFTREEDVRDRTQEWGLLQIHRSKHPASSTEEANDKTVRSPELEPKNDPESIWQRRQEMLNRHFPVTLARIRRSKLLKAYKKEFASQGVQTWQIEQAICNLVLSRAICGKDHYIDLSEKDFSKKMFSALQGRFEQADGKDCVAELSRDTIQHQVILDCNVLLGLFAIKPKATSFCTLVAQLGEEGLLGG